MSSVGDGHERSGLLKVQSLVDMQYGGLRTDWRVDIG
jgi:hypothetical protein